MWGMLDGCDFVTYCCHHCHHSCSEEIVVEAQAWKGGTILFIFFYD